MLSKRYIPLNRQSIVYGWWSNQEIRGAKLPNQRPSRGKRKLLDHFNEFLFPSQLDSYYEEQDRRHDRENQGRDLGPQFGKFQDFQEKVDEDFDETGNLVPIESVADPIWVPRSRGSVRIVDEVPTEEAITRNLRLSETAHVFEDRKQETTKALQNSLSKFRVGVLPVSCRTLQSNSDHAAWGFSNKSVIVSGFFSSKSGNNSEDSEPLMVVVDSQSSGNSRMMIGVFDGMGGAGASIIESSSHSYTEAYRASRIIRQKTNELAARMLADCIRSGKPRAVTARELTIALKETLQLSAQQLGVGSSGSSRIRGTLTKTLPSTLACAEIAIKNSDSGSPSINVFPIWAGDSRVWILTPMSGLQQVTADDVDIKGPLEQLRQDPPMANVVSASVEFALNQHHVQLSGPCLVIAGTDGISGYVRSPGEVELLILKCIEVASLERRDLAEVLHSVFSQLANDDASCVVAAIGFENLDAIRAAFQNRLEMLEDRYAMFDSEEELISFSEIVDKIWAEEAKRYCACMPGGES